jgi:N-methylhydantoinase B
MTLASVADEVLANHFRAIAEEMSHIVLRAAHTTFVKETQDYAAALVTLEGEVFAYPHTTGVTSLLGIPMRAGTQAFADWKPGDILITNDPYATSGMVMHLPDLYLMKPVFHAGELLCFTWTFMHCSDVGGMVPGSTDMQATEIFQEGLRLRPVKLYKEGQLNEELWHIIADNCRIPKLNRGDIGALVAALNTGEKRFQRLADKYGLVQVRTSIRRTLDRTEERTKAVLRGKVKPGEYRFVDYLEDDYATQVPVRIEVALKARQDGTVTLDFSGCDPQVPAALNLPTGNQKHHPFLSLAVMNFVVTHAEAMHLNAGLLRPIDLVLPQASVVNASFPASCGMRYLTAMRAHDAVLGALAQATGHAVPAAGAGEIAVTLVATSDVASSTVQVAVANPVQGGTGGGPHDDGVAGIDYPVAFLRNVPAEVLESEMPVLVHRFALIPDSEGPGKYRGGHGVEYEIEVNHPNALIVMRGKERYRFQPWGTAGGYAGSNGSTVVRRPDQSVLPLGKQSKHRPDFGEVLAICGAGGGGYGRPHERDPQRVLRDVEDGLVSAERARSVYAVAFADGAVDTDATGKLRRAKATAVNGTVDFDFGPGRTAWVETYGAASERIATWLRSLQPNDRMYGKAQAYRRLEAIGEGPWSPAAVESVLQDLARTFAVHRAQE